MMTDSEVEIDVETAIETETARAPGRATPGPAGSLESSGPPQLAAIVESVLLVTDKPVSSLLLAQVSERATAEVEQTLRRLSEDYDAQGRGFSLRQVAGGWRLFTRTACAPYVQRFVLDGQTGRLSQAALETLAVIAYRQPVTRSRVGAIRGVNVDGVVRTLMGRGLIAELGNEDGSAAILYGTTPLLLEKLGLAGLDDLPSLAPMLPNLSEEELDEATMTRPQPEVKT